MHTHSDTHLRLVSRRQLAHSPAAHWPHWVWGAVLGAAVLSGCAVVPASPAYGTTAYYDDGYGEVTTATMAPPAPYVEAIPLAPFVGALWIGGYWDWLGGRHVWHAGHYERPRPGFSYRQPGWHQGPGGQWMLHRGGWARGGHR